ncbi:MAG: hypothetical protein B6I38_04220 [Anaerolineaceae bacterium 4572_5.1]|nr:MAG: hypothetical protein B6I38_04220 [Anaerolineaceae bacterium 4572_5.1]RLD06463.1 MAG: hypothetical protein DRI56_08040 [Chloroflexota bacterium]
MRLVDTHCHLDFDNFENDREQVLNRAWEAGMERILLPGVDLASSRKAVRLAESHPKLFAAVGVHPNSALTWERDTLAELKSLAVHPKVVAVGEIGLDYYRHHAPHDAQRRVLNRQLKLALEMELPVILHVRSVSETDQACMADMKEIIRSWQMEVLQKSPSLRERIGVVHSFSGGLEDARQITELGFYLGITGPVTYKSAANLRKVVAGVNVSRLLIETDAPFLAPHPHRGKRNEPAYVRFVAEKISETRGQSIEEIAEATTENANHLFCWSK